MSDTQLTKTGNLPVHFAAAACYVPFMSLNLLASIGFLAMEPKENTGIRFHAAQSLLFQAVWFAGTMVAVVVLVLTQIFGGVLVSMLLMASETVATLGSVAFGLFNLLVLLVVLVVAFGGVFIQLGLAAMAAMEKDPRLPVLGGYAERFTS